MVRSRLGLLALVSCLSCSAHDDQPADATTQPWEMTTVGSDPSGDDTSDESDADDEDSDDESSEDSDDSDPSASDTAPDDTTGDATTDDTADPTTGDSDDTAGSPLDPPAGDSSGGAGGGAAAGDVRMTGDGIQYRIIAPGGGGPLPLLVVFSGTEGGANMTNNLMQVAGFTGTDGFVFAVLDGVQYNGNGQAGVSVLDQVRADYDIDNDRTYLLGESAGTTAALELGLSLRQSYFAAYWANDVNASAAPVLDAAALGFQPFGNAGPGGQFAAADAIVAGMEAAGYRTPEPSPYDGPGAETHGDVDQFIAALSWFPGKTRQ